MADNDGRLDESCVGDLVVLEAQAAGLEGIVIWGLHRDTIDIQAIGLPVFSLGAIPAGPQRLDSRAPDALASATVGDWAVDREDLVLGDDDGVLFVPATHAGDVFEPWAGPLRNNPASHGETPITAPASSGLNRRDRGQGTPPLVWQTWNLPQWTMPFARRRPQGADRPRHRPWMPLAMATGRRKAPSSCGCWTTPSTTGPS